MSEWRDVPDYEGRYLVSDDGRLLSLRSGLMRPPLNDEGYRQIVLVKDGKQRCLLLHRLVALAFVPNPDGKPTVNHINEDKEDNRAVNLEWTTMRENDNHATRNARIADSHRGRGGKRKPVRMLTEGGLCVREYRGVVEAANEMGINATSISKCLRGARASAGGFIWRYV